MEDDGKRTPDACTCGHDRNDHSYTKWSFCRLCKCVMFEPDDAVTVSSRSNA